jgi:ADP-ribosylglycohydrolase
MYFFQQAESIIARRLLLGGTWEFTDDTLMAISLFGSLMEFGQIEQGWLAADFAGRYDPSRGYVPSMQGQLLQVRLGKHWRDAASMQFEGQGSFGNGAAMRIAPLGAYFADDLDLCVEQARLSSEVTHYHPEGIAGGIAIAIAAAQAVRFREAGQHPTRAEFIDSVLLFVPESEVWEWCQTARDLDMDCSLRQAAGILGTVYRVSAQDTVPFCLWVAGTYLDNYEEALWQTLSGMGDRDTTCAIVGGIVASYTGGEAIPEGWRNCCDPLPRWICE